MKAGDVDARVSIEGTQAALISATFEKRADAVDHGVGVVEMLLKSLWLEQIAGNERDV